MKEYESREEAVRDPDLNLRIIWECDRCGEELETCACDGDYDAGKCQCGGRWQKVGESYNA